MSTAATQGTSIEVLAPYLPYGIELQTVWTDGSENMRCVFRGWRHKDLSPYRIDATYILGDGEDKWEAGISLEPSKALPVLRSFADLCSPLPDGTIAVVELAKFLVADSDDDLSLLRATHWKKNRYIKKEHISVSFPLSAGHSRNYLMIYSDWFFYPGVRHTAFNYAAAINYLRSQHFAVGLEPHQYICKTN